MKNEFEQIFLITKKHIEQLPMFFHVGDSFIFEDDWIVLNNYLSAILLSSKIEINNKITVNGLKYQLPYRRGFAKGIKHFDELIFEKNKHKVRYLKEYYPTWKYKSENVLEDNVCFEISNERFEQLGYFTALRCYTEQWAKKEFRFEILQPEKIEPQITVPQPEKIVPIKQVVNISNEIETKSAKHIKINPRTSDAKLKYLEITNWYIDCRKSGKPIEASKHNTLSKKKIGIDTFRKALKANSQILIGTEFEADFAFLKPKVK